MNQEAAQNITDPVIRQRYQKYLKLPKVVQDQLFSVQTANKILEAGKKNNLDSNQISKSAYLVGLILLGELNIVDFVKELSQRCQLEGQAAKQLARDINQAVFLPVKEELKEIHQIDQWPREQDAYRPSHSSQSPASSSAQHVVNLKE